jgi:hypothetical protein
VPKLCKQINFVGNAEASVSVSPFFCAANRHFLASVDCGVAGICLGFVFGIATEVVPFIYVMPYR